MEEIDNRHNDVKRNDLPQNWMEAPGLPLVTFALPNKSCCNLYFASNNLTH
jgi:hypothetical protein